MGETHKMGRARTSTKTDQIDKIKKACLEKFKHHINQGHFGVERVKADMLRFISVYLDEKGKPILSAGQAEKFVDQALLDKGSSSVEEKNTGALLNELPDASIEDEPSSTADTPEEYEAGVTEDGEEFEGVAGTGADKVDKSKQKKAIKPIANS